MRFAYMDEAGNTGRKCDEPNQPIHLILTLIVDEENIAALHEHVRETGRRHCLVDCTEDDFEFHGHDIFSGRGYFGEMTPEKRIEIYDDILKGIELAEAEVIVRGVEKAGLARRYVNPYHPHDIALMYTIESIERMARTHDCRVLLVADEAKWRRFERELSLPGNPPKPWKSSGSLGSSHTSARAISGIRSTERKGPAEAGPEDCRPRDFA